MSERLPKVQCPFCRGWISRVVDGRPRPSRGAFRRRRQCLSCLKRYWTYEVVETQKPHNI